MIIDSIQQLDLNKRYTYADYLTWRLQEQVELIRGKIFHMSPAPNMLHQRVSRQLVVILAQYLQGKTCEVFHAPFDVRLPAVPARSKANEVDTVVQPDITVVCDPSKLDKSGCLGAPDLVVEILSPGNARKEVKDKFELYQHAGIPHYWIIHPEEHTLLMYTLDNQGNYQASRLFTRGDEITHPLFPNLIISLDQVFEQR